jgi:EF hand
VHGLVIMKTTPLGSRLRAGAAGLFLICATGLLAEEATVAGTEVPPSVLARFDKNKDGKLDAAERAKWEAENARRREKDAARKAELLARFDTNKDGKLDADERASAKLAMMQERTEADSAKMKTRLENEAKTKAEAAAVSAAVTDPAPAAAPVKEGDDKMMQQ